MPELVKIIATAVVGVMIFVVGQIVQRLWIDPVHELRKTLGRIAHGMTIYDNVQTKYRDDEGELHDGDPGAVDEASKTLHSLAAELRAVQAVVPMYPVTARIFGLPSRANIKRAAVALHQWSISVHVEYGGNDYRRTIDNALELGVLWFTDFTGTEEGTGRRVTRRAQDSIAGE